MNIFKFFLIAVFVGALLLVQTGCVKQEQKIGNIYELSSYGKMELTIMSLRDFGIAPVLGDTSYQWVKESEVSKVYQIFKTRMFSDGVVIWNQRFDCNKFSLAFVSFYQTKYFVKTYGVNGIGQSIAVGEIYYKPDSSTGNHAINVLVINGEFNFF